MSIRHRPLLAPALSALALVVLSALPLRAQSRTVVTVTASVYGSLFATTSPVVETVRFAAPTAAQARAGWVSAENTTMVTSRANVAHRVTIVAMNGCRSPRAAGGGDDAHGATGVEWSNDDGRTWHALGFTPVTVAARTTAGRHTGPRVSYRHRIADATEPACTARVLYTAIPER